MIEWATAPFDAVYNSIELDSFKYSDYERILPDLKTLNVLNGKTKNSASRSQLEKGEIKLSSGDSYRVNREFIIAAIILSDELNLDEVVTAELMLQNCDVESEDENSEVSLVNDAKVAYYMRRQYILQIVSFITNCCSSTDKVYIDLVSDGELVKNIISAFGQIENQLEEIKQLVYKTRILENYDAFAKHNVRFRRDFLLTEYDTLSQVLYGLVKNGALMTKDRLLELVDRVSAMDSSDFFIIYFLPAILHAFSQLHLLPDNDVRDIHKQFVADLHRETIYTQPVKVSLIFAFLAFFIGWCKASPATRATSFDFATAVDEPMTMAVDLGAIEQLMAFAADTSELEKDGSIELFYDIRSLLERHIPRLRPGQLIDSDQLSSEKSSRETVFEYVTLSQQAQSFFLFAFNQLLQVVITDCAYLLTKMKDAEEDSLLSGEDLFLDEISAKADLERFFLTIHYFYAFRQDYCAIFWQDKESNAYGFIEWAMKCSDTLMRSCVFLMLSSLSFGPTNSLNVYHYVNINPNFSWSNIAQIISDYIFKISELERKLQDSQQKEKGEQETAAIALTNGLNEEAIILLSSLYTLIGCVSHDLEEDTKSQFSALFTDILFEFVKVNTPLVGAALKVLSNLVPQNENERSGFWSYIDSWIFKGFKLTIAQSSYQEAFESVLTCFSDVTGFLQLVQKLLKVCTKGVDGYLEFGLLPFPTKLGHGYRNTGVWPYFDYIFHKVLVQSCQLKDLKERAAIQVPILQIIDNALRSFEYSVILNSIPAGSNLNDLVVTDDFFAYVQESPATAVINYLFEGDIFKVVLDNASLGVDDLSCTAHGANESQKLLRLAVGIIIEALNNQETYVEELCPIVKKNSKEGYFLPKDFGLHGLKSLYDAIFFDLPIIAHFGLYVGLEDYSIASQSLQILEKLSSEMKGRDNQAIVKDKLLSLFDSVDESARVKEAFIYQLRAPIINEKSLELKLNILKFLSHNLSYTDKQPSVAHFLLGFFVGSTVSLGPELGTFIMAGNSVLDSVIYLLHSSLEVMTSENIDHAPTQIASFSMEILLKLCRNALTSTSMLRHLSDLDLFEKQLALDPKVGASTKWSGERFCQTTNKHLLGFTKQSSCGAFLSFLRYRGYFLQYLSLDIHRLSGQVLRAKISSRIDLLISNVMQPPRMFSFLDVLNFDVRPPSSENLKSLTLCAGLDLTELKVEEGLANSEAVFDIYQLNSLIQLRTQSLSKCLPIALPDSTISDIKALLKTTQSEATRIKESLTNIHAFNQFKSSQLSVLHSWVQLIQIVVLDGRLAQEARSNFILELFEAIVPKINDYVELDVAYSEEVVSLCVFLYDIYHKDHHLHTKEKSVDGRLLALFMACINGIRSPLSTLSLRSDFYVLANRFLLSVLKDHNAAKQVFQTLKMTSERLVEVICNDAISGEGSSRITGIILLDSLVQISGLNKVNFILESLVKTNMLLLIGHSMKATDDFLKSGLEGMTLDSLLYELTAFKSTVHFLIRVAETRAGAQALVENEIFHVIESCGFLQLDPDLGLDLTFSEVNVHHAEPLHVSLSLDNSLSLSKDACGLSLFEIIVPVFQLMASIILSMGSANKPVVKKTRSLLAHFRGLVQGVLKRDALVEDSEAVRSEDANIDGLQQLVKLVVLLCTLTGYSGGP
ncbi:LANO_0H09516g1_1 [Lachancea nothofagi CBS 11611]|uniref:LANO_0H09516g1_1 n=1 Tax=Lachancea nothofagi CBS 11611 TaxID=1266666 RepID=A0A1G4KM02_9SACH|nr:LANO_0H09516g1_1 [Lachancea nothofagi CBS 11611]